MKSSIMTDTIARKDFIKQIKSLDLNRDYTKGTTLFKNSHTPDLFKDKFENLQSQINLENILKNGMEKLISDTYKEKRKNFTNFIFLSVFGKQEDIYNYILEIFKENSELKQSEFYILFMIRSGQIKNLVIEQKDILFQNFYFIFLILLENLEYFYDINVHLFFETLLFTESTYVK